MLSKVTRLLVIVILIFLILGLGTSAWALRENRHIYSGHRHGTIQSHFSSKLHFGHRLRRNNSLHSTFRRRGHSPHHPIPHLRDRSFYFGHFHDHGGFYFGSKIWVPGQWAKTQAGYWVWKPGFWVTTTP